MSDLTPLSDLDRRELRRFAAEVVEYHDDLREKDLDWGPHLHQDQERELCEITVRLLDRLEQLEEQYKQDHAELQAYRQESVEAAADRRLHRVLQENRRLADQVEGLREVVRRLGVLDAEAAEDFEPLHGQDAEHVDIDRLRELLGDDRVSPLPWENRMLDAWPIVDADGKTVVVPMEEAGGRGWQMGASEEDIDLIVAAVNALPALLDQLEQAREAVRRLGVLYAELAEDYEALYRQESELADIDHLVEEPEAAEFIDRIAAGDKEAFGDLLAWLNHRLRNCDMDQGREDDDG